MKLKDLFKSTNIIKSSSLEDLAADVESVEFIEQHKIDETRFYPNVDFSEPKNFAFYGSAEKYYTDAFERIRTLYPYDGSEAEKKQWINDSTFIDMYIFDNKYPRFSGYVNLGYPSWGNLSGTLIDGYGKSNTNTYIKTFGGPNQSDLNGLKNQFGDANKLDSSVSRESNLKFNLEEGVTLEMWVKKPTFDTSKTEKEVLFDLWNGEASSSAQYGRLRLELTGASSGSPFLFTALSGTSGVQYQQIGQNVATSSIEGWTHIALSLKNSGSDISANFYLNGQLNHQQTISSAAIGNVTGSLISYIGALQTAPSGSPTVQEGAGKFSGSLDEFRYWKTERTSKDIGRYYWTHIGGGTNTDEANTTLGVYYKFNEGITENSSYDSVILDYSGRVSNGTWVGYASGARSTDSAMELAGVIRNEFKDPTIRSIHPEYVSTLTELETIGQNYDIQNNSAIFHTMPQWILETNEEKNGVLKNLTQIIGSYFDNLHIHIGEINKIKDIYSHFQTVETDEFGNTSTSGSVKPFPFADRLLTNIGFVAPELFVDASVIEKMLTRSEDENYEMKIADVKNQIYQNIYSGLINTYKQKGTNKGFRNILHAFGIDEEVVKINFYGDNIEYDLRERYSIRSTKEKFIDFNFTDRFEGSVYQISSGSNLSYITGSTSEFEKFIPFTFETQVVLPNKIPWDEPYGFETPFTKSVIAGFHQASDNSDYSIPSTDNCHIQIYVERDESESKRVKFHLSSSALGVHLTSSLYEDMYDNNEWLFAFKLVNDKYPSVNSVSSSDDADYTLSFVGYNTSETNIINSFEQTASVSLADAQSFLTNSKRMYLGAKRQNFTGSLEERSDVKVGFARIWYNDLTNDTLLKHSYDSRNYGANSPLRSAYLMQDEMSDVKVPEIDTLILNWDFKTLSKTDVNGQAIILDASSGSAESKYNTNFENVKNKFYFGKLDFMQSNDEKAIDVEYISAARSTYPEILQGDDMIEIRNQDDVQFTSNTLPQEYYIAFEKSMSQTISQEMINFMSSVTDFNNLIGRPVERYRMTYKGLAKLRQLFFERVANEPDLDKYIDYYKWLDDALGEMLVALVPASLSHSDGINNVIENYVFSRDKYDNKFPTMEFKSTPPEGGMNTINRHLYPWKQGHAPTSGQEDENCFWWAERKEKEEPRTKIFQARNSVLNRSFTTAQHFDVKRNKVIHGGTNYEDNKKRDYVWSATKEVSESPLTYGEFGGFPLRYILANSDMFQSLKDCSDERPVTEKIKRAFSAVDGFMAFHHDMSGGYDGIFKGGMVMPFNIMSSSVTTGYSDIVNGLPGAGENIDIVNLHSDTTDLTNEIPMQSPFTERWVGGHQSRHAPINDGNDSEATRGEGYKILINNIENQSGSIGVVGADYPYPYANQADAPFFRIDQAKARYYREERVKRPVNIKNIKTDESQVGNYSKTYQFVHTFGRGINKTGFRDIADTNMHNTINSQLPETNLEASLVSRGTEGSGNVASNFDSSNLYLGGIKETTEVSITGTGRSVIANRFSAPGGFETMSEVFLDMYGKEKSAYNALPFRNLLVRGLSSGENGTIRLEDIHGNRYGLRTHLTRHADQFGIDSVIGGESPAFHKVNRNPKWDASEQSKDYDNYWVQHQIPQSDYQYQWVKNSHTASLATSSLSGHLLSDMSEPSGATSRFPHEYVENTMISQSVIDQRIDGTTAYGYPSWEQIRNNDRTKNIQIKKSYGYSIEKNGQAEMLEESRIVSNIPNFAEMSFKDEKFRFIYPYVNMKYHFDNKEFENQGVANVKNETVYDSILGYYKNEDHESFSLEKMQIRQNLFPDFLRHTKFNTRHRHHFVSNFWTDGENELYNSDTGPESYFGLDEVGRRKTNITASLFTDESINTQIINQIDDAYLNNIIPSQSIWSMDSRTNFTSSDPQSAASNSAGAPGVLQNQDHHFHNGQVEQILTVSGTTAEGSFKLNGATRFGTYSSGSFTVQGMQPTGIPASGSFEITGANVQGTQATGEFTTAGSYVNGVSASAQFDVIGRTVLGTSASGSFTVSGAAHPAVAATSSFDIKAPIPGTFSSLTFTAAYQFALDGDYVVVGRNGSSNQAIIDINGTTVSSPNVKLSPVVYQRAREFHRSEYASGSTALGTQQDWTFSFWLNLDTQLNNGNKSVLYTSLDSIGNTSLEIYFTGSSNDLVIKQYVDNNTNGRTGILTQTFNAIYGTNGWFNLVLFIDGMNEVQCWKNGSQRTPVGAPVYTDYIIGNTITYFNIDRHYVFNSTSIDSGKNAKISDLIIWTSYATSVNQATTVGKIYKNNGTNPSDTTTVPNIGSKYTAHYTFGDDAGDGTTTGQFINDIAQDRDIIINGFTSDVDSVFATKMTKTEWFDHIKTQLLSLDTNNTYLTCSYDEYQITASSNYASQWYYTGSDPFKPGTTYSNQIVSGDTLNYATFYLISKSKNTSALYDITNASIYTDPIYSGLSSSFTNFETSSNSSADINIVSTIPDHYFNMSSITVSGTNFAFESHVNGTNGLFGTYDSSLQMYDTVRKGVSYDFAGAGYSANAGSGSLWYDYTTTGVAYDTTNGYTPNGDFTISFWYHNNGDDSQNDGIITVVGTDGGANVNINFKIEFVNNILQLKVYSGLNNTDYKSFGVSETMIYGTTGLSRYRTQQSNHYVVSYRRATHACYMYVNGIQVSVVSSTVGASFSSYNNINILTMMIAGELAGLFTATPNDCAGVLSDVAFYETYYANYATPSRTFYNQGTYYDHSSQNITYTSKLVHWWLADESEFPADGYFTSPTTIYDRTPRQYKLDLTMEWYGACEVRSSYAQSYKTYATLVTGTVNTINNFSACTYTASAVDTDTVLLSNKTAGSAGNGDVMSEDSGIITNLVTLSQDGSDAYGSTENHSLRISNSFGSKFFIVDSSGRSDTSTEFYIDNTSTDQVFWNDLSQSIKDSTNYDIINISGTGLTRTFSITSSITGTNDNGAFANSGDSFLPISDPQGGTDESGAVDGNYLRLYMNGYKRLYVDRDNDGVSNATYKYVSSVTSTDTDWWDNLKAAIELFDCSVSYVDNGNNTATFTIVSGEDGAAGNETIANFESGVTFTVPASPNNVFAGGIDTSGAEDGDTITIDGTTFQIIHSGTPTATQVLASGVTDATFWESLRSKIETNTSYTAATGSDDPRTFTLTSTATGSSEDPNISESGTTFTIVDAGTAGTDESGAEDGDYITIDGTNFPINLSTGLGTGSTTSFHNALSQSIKNLTDFDTITISDLGTGYYRFSLTSSVTGTAKNVAFSQNSNGSRVTFQNLLGAAGGTSPIGIGDLDYIRFIDTSDLNPDSAFIYFRVDTDGNNSSSNTYKYIDTSGYTGTDSEKSTQFWNDLSAAIKTWTTFDDITITELSNVATFSLTSSITGSAYNSDLSSVYNGADGIGFTITQNTVGGTDESGAHAGDTITIDGTTFTIVHNASPSALQINASGVTDVAFFNAMTAAIEANTDFSASYTVASSTGSFNLGTDVTGTSKNSTITSTGTSFTQVSGTAGAEDPVYKYTKFASVVPTPRYNYPHALVSPGSLRAPTAKSNLGLISPEYKLRSNHFNLTRSLGLETDGLYDNTSRWQTPDLSGLTPFDNDYNDWYENIRGHNKHFSLVPEFRISSHVKGIVNSGTTEVSYFKNNYWLEITGASLEGSASANKNTIDISGNEFLKEYSLSTNIRNMENFINENGNDTSIAKITLTCDAIMSFLPYDGFYPQSRTVQLCEAFANSYGKHFTSEEADPDNTELEFPDNNVMTQTRPIYDAIMSPGLLYNTIKSGMAVDYPIITSKLATASLTDPYGGKNYMINNEYFDDRLPFETLIKPEAYLKDKKIVDANPHVSSSLNLKSKWNGLGDINYKLMSNNFFAEVIGFFLQDGRTSKIISKPDTDPDFGVVIANHAGILPVYRSIFKVYKSKKSHPWIEFNGITETLKVSGSSEIDENKKDKYFYRPPSGTNYFMNEYEGLTGSALEYDLEKITYPRPQMNPYAEVETITMYSQPNSFGPPCAGGVAVEFKGIDTDDVTPLTGENNNTTYMMYDSTNGYNAPFTPPYYDGEAWAIYTFTPQRAGKHTLDEIIQNTTVDYLRYELNHESGSFGDRGTFGPQGFSINENAMQIDASFNLFKQVSSVVGISTSPAVGAGTLGVNQVVGKSWVIESKFETPILDFSKYLNREYNAEFESDTTSDDIYTSRLSLSGTHQEPDTLSAVHPSLSTVHELSGILNPIGMWHQFGEFPDSDDKGIFMQMIDVPTEYTLLGTELTIANPKYSVVKPEISDCDGSGLNTGYNVNPGITMKPYFPHQEIRRKLVGKDDLSVIGSSIQLINKKDGIVIDAEIKLEDVLNVYGSIDNAQSASGLFSVFTSSTYTKDYLTNNSLFTGSLYEIYVNSTASSASYPQESSGNYQGHWAAGYYNYDRAGTYNPLLIDMKDYASLSYDYGDFPRGIFEDFLKEFSIGVKYTEQSSDFSDKPDIGCIAINDSGNKKIVPSSVIDRITVDIPTITSLAKVDMSDEMRKDLLGIKSAPTKQSKSFKLLKNPSLTKRFRLIPENPSVQDTPSTSDTSSYDYPEPTFVRASIRYDAGGKENTGNDVPFYKKVQMAPQNDKNFAGNASTVRWGKFMHNEGATAMTQSLAQLVGFTQEKVKMGVTAESKIVKEAVIAIPYISKENDVREFLTLNQRSVNKYLFENKIISTNRALTPRGQSLNLQEQEIEIGSSVIEQINKMQNYSIPPHLDFIENDVAPLPMYIFEFEKELTRDDLNGIWQGVRTENLKKVEFKQSEISHEISISELLGGIQSENGNIDEIKDIKWMIFKVKQKASTNYDKKMSDGFDSGYVSDTQNLDSSISNLGFGYNWPYDYFSMVENVKVSAEIEMIKKEKPDIAIDIEAGYKKVNPEVSTLANQILGKSNMSNVELDSDTNDISNPKLVNVSTSSLGDIIPRRRF